ncbi:MAG: SRPBCC family protein [Deltaproteobacteria bacterium]|jgi:uncharacterized protein YndB with AHSA1/START domain|nr:SRPBCC family protein [Deltaproteobacteria bacterium]
MIPTPDPTAYGTISEDATLTIRRSLPGPIERVWAYLTESQLRRQWLAAGEMSLLAGAPFRLTWRNDELTRPSGQRPAGFGEEHQMESQIIEADPPHRLVFTWSNSGQVSIELEARGDEVLLTLIHRRLPNRNTTLMVGAGWHAHLDILVARVSGAEPPPFWDGWTQLRQEYDRRVPA